MSNKTNAGTVNLKEISESVNSIEFLTKQYRSKRINTETYIKLIHENLSKLTTQRNYTEYLKNIGQRS